MIINGAQTRKDAILDDGRPLNMSSSQALSPVLKEPLDKIPLEALFFFHDCCLRGSNAV